MKLLNRHVTDDLSAYLQNELSIDQVNRVEKHLANCQHCQREYAQIERGILLAKHLPLSTCPEQLWLNINTQLQRQQTITSITKTVALPRRQFARNWTMAAIVSVMLLVTIPFFYAPKNGSINNRSINNSFSALARNIETSGALESYDHSGKRLGFCALTHTDVKAVITGFVTRVNVTQHFVNPFNEKIEANYTFPLPQDAAVDSMTMTIGDRVIKGQIKEREEAKAIYQQARQRGQIAGLLDQQRPNIFTQQVANILPGVEIEITISYVEVLKYQNGGYQFVFPTVVGPRYIPGNIQSANANDPANQFDQIDQRAIKTDQVPDAAKITPPIALTRTGHDISIEVALDAGVNITNLTAGHDLEIDNRSSHSALVRLKEQAMIPNKDFVLKYQVGDNQIQEALLTHFDKDLGGFFTLILQPPAQVIETDVRPKELVFVLDTSGSMAGAPIEKAKQTINLALNNLYPQDRFNLITFSGDTRVLFEQPVAATVENLTRAKNFLNGHYGDGGTEMMKAIETALAPSDNQDHIRIVCFMTDGYVGNDMEIIAEVQKHPNARVFSFGIGDSVNRFLLDKIAIYGRGEAEYIMLNDDAGSAAERFFQRVRNPLLTDISIDWNNLPITDTYPKQIPDLFSVKPLIITGRYYGEMNGVIHLKGSFAGSEYNRDIAINSTHSINNNALAKLWARQRIDQLMGFDYAGLQYGNMATDIRAEITRIGLDFGLMTQFTSFVAVDEQSFTGDDSAIPFDVPIELPNGVSENAIDTNRQGVLPYLNPMPRYEINQPGNVLRQFERGGITQGLPSDIGSPDADEDPGRVNEKLSERGFGTKLLVDPTFQTDANMMFEQRINTVPEPSPLEQTSKGVLPFLNPILRVETKQSNTGNSDYFVINATGLIAPKLNRFLNGNIFYLNLKRQLLFTWSNVVVADRYKIEVSLSPNFASNEMLFSYEVHNNQFSWQQLKEGKFYWRVKALDRFGNESGWSQTQSFTVKG